MIELEKLTGVVGDGNASSDPSVLDAYSKDISFVNPVRPACDIWPDGTEAVREVIRLARETQTPLVPVSSGTPRFRGDTVPGLGGAIVVDLSRMKKIIRADRLNRVVMFEPGVSFSELIPAAAKEGLRLNMPLLPRMSKSVVGSLLEREPVIMPKYHWDISDPLNCIEVIFGTGDMFRTGAAAGPGTLEEQWAAGGAQVEAAGPSSNSWYRVIQGSQGTMGIVTWASVRCEIIPSAEAPFLVGSAEIGKIVEMVHWLVRLRLVNECFILNRAQLAAMMAQDRKEYASLKASLPAWVLFYNVAGYDFFPEERVSGQIKDIGDLAQRLGLEPQGIIGGIASERLLEICRKPSEEPYWKLRCRGACQSLPFLTIYDILPAQIDTINATAEELEYPASDLAVYLQPVVQGTNCHVECSLFYDPENPQEAASVREFLNTISGRLIDRGAFFSRPYGENAQDILNHDAATVAALKKVKSILDPANIMNPGKLCF